MEVLVICRPHPTTDVTSPAWTRFVPAEAEALRRLRDDGLLTRMWSPGRPGAVLLLDGDEHEIRDRIAELPLVVADMIAVEVIPLQPLPL